MPSVSCFGLVINLGAGVGNDKYSEINMSSASAQQQIEVQVFGTKEFTHSHQNLYKQGGNRRNIFRKLNDLIAVVGIEGASAFKSFKTTKHGETRIKSCIKFDLGDAFRLVTVQSNRIVWLLFCGSHDECV